MLCTPLVNRESGAVWMAGVFVFHASGVQRCKQTKKRTHAQTYDCTRSARNILNIYYYIVEVCKVCIYVDERDLIVCVLCYMCFSCFVCGDLWSVCVESSDNTFTDGKM